MKAKASKGRNAVDTIIERGMSDKKQHEVVCMAALVDQVVESSGTDVVVDAGSGLVSEIYSKKYTTRLSLKLINDDLFMKRIFILR